MQSGQLSINSVDLKTAECPLCVTMTHSTMGTLLHVCTLLFMHDDDMSYHTSLQTTWQTPIRSVIHGR